MKELTQQMLQQLSLSMETKITLYGASGHCKVIIDILQNCNIGIDTVFDDNPDIITILGIPVYKADAVIGKNFDNLIISIGNNKTRKILSAKLNANYAVAIHPKAIVSSHSIVEAGTVIMAGAIVNPDAKIGKHCIINTSAVIEHDCIINDFAHISPNVALAGGVKIGEGTQIGIGAAVIQGIKIGKWAIIGAGAVIINDIPDYAVVVGNPGKIIKHNK